MRILREKHIGVARAHARGGYVIDTKGFSLECPNAKEIVLEREA